jgi:hypothetical protein
MKSQKKSHDSDDEAEMELANREPTQADIIAQQLESAPVIPDSEVSPAAYIFQNQEEHDDLNLYEEK